LTTAAAAYLFKSIGLMVIKPTITAKRLARSLKEGWPVIVEEGGSSSGKTYGTVFVLILLAADPVYRKQILGAKWPALAERPLRISIVSDSLPHIKKGALRDFKTNMLNLNLWDTNNWSATDFIYTFKDGSYIELFGLEDESKAKGPRRDILYMNEANNNTFDVYRQLSMRTAGPKILDLNPSEFNSWVYKLADNPENKKLHSTYLDNIENLTPSQIAEIEGYKNLPDPFWWEVYGLGQRGASIETIYRGWEYVDALPGKGDVFFGIDFGFNHPTALTKVEKYDGAFYVQEVIYKSGLTKPELTDLMKELVPMGATIYADSAEPDSIEELYRNGFNIKPSNKDVWNGIMNVKGKRVFVTRDSANVISEVQSYRWKKDKNGNILEEPIKDKDDAMDSIRYAIHTHESAFRINFFTI
jgi:phage terminase large subunit